MSQTRLSSLFEALVNIVVGFSITFFANMLILPMFGFVSMTMGKNLGIGGIYTLISLTRSYVLRRCFNNIHWGNRK